MGTIFHNQNVINSRINSVPEVKIIFVVIAWVVMYLSILNVENHFHYIVNYVLKQIFLK
jgi:endo-alpha-1,4-polygalactosaminidase (GH114 family)